MNAQEAKLILAAYRPGSRDADDPRVAEALEQVQRDPSLKSWFDQHAIFQNAMRESFRRIPVPEDFIGSIVRPAFAALRFAWWERRALWAAAAGIALLLTLSLPSPKSRSQGSLEVYRARMVRAPLREYRMDVVTNDMAQIRRFLAANRAPSDYELPGNLARLTPVGAGLLSWQGQRVSMVCLESDDKNPAFLFVVDQSAISRPPKSAPEFAQVNRLMTASWTQGNKVYVLAAPGDVGALRELMNPKGVKP